ncbi:hypothetical protein SAMN04488128_101884 [Chitinophaga eiseniae]|uniref:DUF4276 family protein n=1 Tax=Chitinophaga eiseniae TaxID=634771 RepID=A0A1T4M1B7_9BACT|nr:hypothetical protein [Chitinophaga eiseniae]SJZ60514.1 hypothetical protein SAMN04488128_101884 [Chitinophaga eiseniae]
MDIDIVGEDPVTQAIIERLIKEYRTDLVIKNRLPVRGGQIQSLAPKFNLLDSPVFLLTDLDEFQCPPSLIKKWLGNTPVNPRLIFRIAQEEAETWLMADRAGFSKWLGVDIKTIPEPKIIDRRKGISEIIFPLKPSLYMMMKIVPSSKNADLKDKLIPKPGAGKGPAYNSALLPFIEKIWNVENAAKHSYSLQKAILRLRNY